MIQDKEEWLNKEKIESYRMFTILCDGIYSKHHKGTGWIQLKCRLSDMTSEGVALFIEVTDNLNEKIGQFADLELDKEELGQFIKYLQDCHSQMPDEEIKLEEDE